MTLINKAERVDHAKNNYPFNITLSLDPPDNAARLIADTFYTDKDVTNDNDFTQRYNMEITTANATSYAIVIEKFIDEVLREYSDAIDLLI